MDICRICTESAQYDIFNHELMFEQKKNVKIYIILNNFLFEKLYGPDEYSSYICENCCENLYNSYTFMETVRNSERQLRSEPPPPKKSKISFEVPIIEQPAVPPQLDVEEVIQDDIPVQFDDIDDHFISEPFAEEDEILTEQFIEEPKTLEVKKEAIKDTVTFLDYVLEHKEEKNQKYVSVRVDRKIVKIRDSYDFNVINHSDPATIYSCLYCVKAFGNLELLMKHLSTCHVCMICFNISSSYMELNEHLKEDHREKLRCPFCKNSFNHKTLRTHIKKQHNLTNLPNYYSILVE